MHSDEIGIRIEFIHADHFHTHFFRNFRSNKRVMGDDIHFKADGAVRLWLDDSLLLDAWGEDVRTVRSVQLDVEAGRHLVQLEYADLTGAAAVAVTVGDAAPMWTPDPRRTATATATTMPEGSRTPRASVTLPASATPAGDRTPAPGEWPAAVFLPLAARG